jgi:rod shape-determining protein MreC
MNRFNVQHKLGSATSTISSTHQLKRRTFRFGGNRLFLLFLLISIILHFVPGAVKTRVLAYPRAILLAPLNIALRFFTDFYSLRQENTKLSMLSTQLQMENAALKEILRNKVSEFSLPRFSMKRAQIIGRDRETMGCFILLDQGESAGIKINMPVITEFGVVGKVIQTSPLQSLVETMLSRDSKIAALNQRGRVNGVVTAQGTNKLKLNYVMPEADIRIGDTIISSGIGGVFPKGFLIGTVTKIDNSPQGLFKDIIIKPFVNIYAIEATYVITGEIKPEAPKIKAEPEKVKTEWEKALKQIEIEPPLEIKIR